MQDTEDPVNDNGKVTRRRFIQTAATAAASLTIVPRRVLGRGFQAPSDTVNVATVGVSGMGAVNTRAVMSQNVVALCDVDFALLDSRLADWAKPPKPPANRSAAPAPAPPPQPWRDFGPSKAQVAADARWPAQDSDATLQRFVTEQLPRVKKYRDYREMLEKQKDLDARHHRDAGSHARRHRLERDDARQARLRAEADVLVGARSPAPGEEGARDRRSSARWATSATRPTSRAAASSTS